jgi:hypothetical protein
VNAGLKFHTKASKGFLHLLWPGGLCSGIISACGATGREIESRRGEGRNLNKKFFFILRCKIPYLGVTVHSYQGTKLHTQES